MITGALPVRKTRLARLLLFLSADGQTPSVVMKLHSPNLTVIYYSYIEMRVMFLQSTSWPEKICREPSLCHCPMDRPILSEAKL